MAAGKLVVGLLVAAAVGVGLATRKKSPTGGVFIVGLQAPASIDPMAAREATGALGMKDSDVFAATLQTTGAGQLVLMVELTGTASRSELPKVGASGIVRGVPIKVAYVQISPMTTLVQTGGGGGVFLVGLKAPAALAPSAAREAIQALGVSDSSVVAAALQVTGAGQMVLSVQLNPSAQRSELPAVGAKATVRGVPVQVAYVQTSPVSSLVAAA